MAWPLQLVENELQLQSFDRRTVSHSPTGRSTIADSRWVSMILSYLRELDELVEHRKRRKQRVMYDALSTSLLKQHIDAASRPLDYTQVMDLKIVIEAREGFPPEQQKLTFGDRTLVDGSTLADCGIHKEPMLHPGYL